MAEPKPQSSDVEQTSELLHKSPLHLEHVLLDIGQLGRFQLRVLLLAAVVGLFWGFQGDFVFTAARVNTRCLIPECDTDSPEFSPTWLLNATPVNDSCHRYLALNESHVYPTCPASLFNRSAVVPCEEFVYENHHGVVYDFGIGCDEWRRALIGTVRTLGTLVALPITGYVSDRWGRRVALAVNGINTCWLGLARYWTTNYTPYIALQFIEAAVGSGFWVLELVGPEYRVIANAVLATCVASGYALMGLLAWMLPAWRSFTLALYAPQIVSLTYLFIFPESIRWYMSKGLYEKSEAVLKKIARTNNKELSQKALDILREHSINEKKRESLSKPWLVVRVFRYKRVLLRCVVTPLWWATMTMVYYGLLINSVHMSGKPYLNYMLVALANIPGFWLNIVLLPRIGRRPTLMAGFWINAACQISYIFISPDMKIFSLAVYMIGKCSIAMVGSALYVYTSEIYPTECRHSLFAYSSMMGRLGTITATLTPAISAVTFEKFPFVLFSVLALVSGATVLLTPETVHTKLPDTMEQANQLGNNSKK